jgi:hypothetical protein
VSAASASSAEDGVSTATTVQRSSGNLGLDNPHRVRRLRWQARAPDAAAAFALQRLLHRHAEAVSMALDEALARIAEAALRPGQVWHLPALTLRLDASSLAQLDADLPGLVAQGLQDALQDALKNELPGTLQPTPDPASRASAPVAAQRHPDAATQPAAEPGRLSTPAQAALAALLTYLATGNLPWALAGLGPEAQQHRLQAAAGAALETLLGMDSANRAAALAELLAPATAPARRIGALLRWLPLLDPAQKQRWLAQTPPPAGITPALAQAWLTLLADPATALEWTALWLVWPTLTPAPRGAAAAGGGRAALAQGDADAVSRWIVGLPAGSTDVRLPAASGRADSGVQDHRLAGALLRSLGAAPAGSDAAATLPAPTAARRAAEPRQASAAAVDAQLVALAGLVLLHPYLPRFLGGCGVLDSAGRAIPEARLPRACAVLHALACGEAGMALAEHQLPLIKLLLGRAPDQPLSAALPRPDASDLAEIDSLLAAVCSHWKALGKTSAAGLRLSFLQRRGLLRPADGAWQLNMQSESFDMLLDLLPWAISLVKLPWMARPLMVEWRAGAP